MVYILSNFENSEGTRQKVQQVQGGDKSNIRVSRPFKGYWIYYENTILIYLANAGCLADPKNPEMILVDPENPKFHMILWPGP